MSRFTEILQVSPLPDGKTWVTRSDFSYDVGKKGSGETIHVPVGFMTDFTSIPRVLWWLLPKWGKYGNAAVIHDWCYWDQQKYERGHADDIFREGMRVLEVKPWQSFMIYWSVKLFGAFPWNNNQKYKEKKPDAKKFSFETMKVTEIMDEMNALAGEDD